MDSSREPSRRYQSLDVWRGLVCVLVVLEHAGVALWPDTGAETGLLATLRGGLVAVLMLNLGTPLFFVMSGYCIASSLVSMRRKGTSPWEFLIRRGWRIVPPYWTALLGFVVLVAGLDTFGLEKLHRHAFTLQLHSPHALTGAQWLGNLTMTETWRPLVGGGESEVYTRIAWALCYQEQFYLVCFAVMLLAPRRLFGAFAAATAAIVGFRILAWDSGALGRIAGLFPIYWHEFAIGLAVYWRLNSASSLWWKRALDLGLLALCVASIGWDFVSTTAAAAFGLMLIGCYRWDAWIGGLRCLGAVRACGRRSYSIYLTHLPVCMLVTGLLAELGWTGFAARLVVMLPLATAASLAVGWWFYWFVESRFTALPDRWRVRFGRAVLPTPALSV